jgi:hypothetical protein
MDGGLMDKEIFAAIVRGDKPEPLAAIEPFHLPGLLASSRSGIFGHRRDGTKEKPSRKEPPRSSWDNAVWQASKPEEGRPRA